MIERKTQHQCPNCSTGFEYDWSTYNPNIKSTQVFCPNCELVLLINYLGYTEVSTEPVMPEETSMRIIISHEGVKRAINGKFAICLSKQNLEHLLETLSMYSGNHVYGWITIPDLKDVQVSTASATLKSWKD